VLDELELAELAREELARELAEELDAEDDGTGAGAMSPEPPPPPPPQPASSMIVAMSRVVVDVRRPA